jgi:hypothetical protein
MPEIPLPEGVEMTEYDGFTVEYRDKAHRYWGLIPPAHDGATGFRAPWVSVTTVLGILDKPALRRWFGTQDATAVLQLEREGKLQGVDTEQAVHIMRERGLGAEAKRDAGASRGTAVHDALAAYCESGKIPRLADYSDEVRGYVQGVAAWILEAQPEPCMVEQIIGSPIHGYAGRFDLIANIRGVRCLCDLKTGSRSGAYPEAHLQLAGYEIAFAECQIPDVDARYVIEVTENGDFRAVEGVGRAEDFLAVLSAHRAVSEAKKAIKAADKAQQALNVG